MLADFGWRLRVAFHRRHHAVAPHLVHNVFTEQHNLLRAVPNSGLEHVFHRIGVKGRITCLQGLLVNTADGTLRRSLSVNEAGIGGLVIM